MNKHTWTEPPKSYLWHNGKMFWPKHGTSTDTEQGAVIATRSDGVLCMRVFEVPTTADEAHRKEATSYAVIELESMLKCNCTPGSDCQFHRGIGPKAILPGTQLPASGPLPPPE